MYEIYYLDITGSLKEPFFATKKFEAKTIKTNSFGIWCVGRWWTPEQNNNQEEEKILFPHSRIKYVRKIKEDDE